MVAPVSLFGAPLAGLRAFWRKITGRAAAEPATEPTDGGDFDLAAPGTEGMAVPERGRPNIVARPPENQPPDDR